MWFLCTALLLINIYILSLINIPISDFWVMIQSVTDGKRCKEVWRPSANKIEFTDRQTNWIQSKFSPLLNSPRWLQSFTCNTLKITYPWNIKTCSSEANCPFLITIFSSNQGFPGPLATTTLSSLPRSTASTSNLSIWQEENKKINCEIKGY